MDFQVKSETFKISFNFLEEKGRNGSERMDKETFTPEKYSL